MGHKSIAFDHVKLLVIGQFQSGFFDIFQIRMTLFKNQLKNSFVCMKAAKLPDQEGHDSNQFGGPAGLRPMIFMGPPLPNDDIDQDKEYCGGKNWRYSYWDGDICWKFIKARFSFLN